MDRLALSLAAISLFAGCAGTAATTSKPASPDDAKAAATAAPKSETAEPALADAAAAPADAAPAQADSALAARLPGDFVVYRFSGTFRKTPLTLTERVLSREGTTLLIEATLEGKGQHEVLDVRMSDAPESRGEVLGVTRITDGKAEAAGPDDYDAMMSEVALNADENEAVLGSSDKTIDVAGTPLPCRTTSYRVKVGGRRATLETVESAAFAWGDVGGAITEEGGRVLYRAEVVQAGRSVEKRETVAASAYEE